MEQYYFHLNDKYEVFVSEKKLLTSKFICVLTLKPPVDDNTIDTFIQVAQFAVDSTLSQLNDNAQELIMKNTPPTESN